MAKKIGQKIINSSDSNKTLTGEFHKIGIQASPGTEVLINKIPIVIGRSGIFELDEDDYIVEKIEINKADNYPIYIDYIGEVK